MYAIFKNGGKQYKVKEGDIVLLDKMGKESKEVVEISEVLALCEEDDIKIGTPFVEGAKVEVEVINEGRAKKITIYKKRRRKDSKLKKGFRREFTRVKVTKIAA